MTTRLLGANTYFLPFNQGSGGAGNVGGKGNPSIENKFKTSYLWENVLSKDSLLEILHKYIHLQIEEKENPKTGKKENIETMIFPRYHQLDVVTKLLKDVKEKGSGQNYLIQHSAGSGKSNSIAWLSHRLSGLHDEADNKIFRSVIIITDRKVLDSQLQDTVFQFDHVPGVVKKIDENSQQLKDAVNAGIPIIITTLQKFPVIYKEIESKNKNFAIIADEAHSSQTGEAIKTVKIALANLEKALEEYADIENEAENKMGENQDKILNDLAAQGKHKNLSFFAFTATPKDKTLQLFGQKGADGKYRAFHIYSMRQAIEEGFILDVLKNYVTYNEYYKIIKNIKDDPKLDSSSASRAVRRFESLHPHNIAQKTLIILEHFRDITKNQIGGKAKAMVVTSSRLHAMRYFLELKKQIKDNNYLGVDVLVAFSGEIDDSGIKYTEESLNKTKSGATIKENQLKKYFHTDDFNMLVVAEKYQTGFDEPYLHTMFVDKKLSGVKAVQTLSRLNRTMKGKNSTFVLDFVNSAQDMKKSFEPYYEAAVLEQETDPNVIYSLKNTLDEFQIYNHNEVERFSEIYFKYGIQDEQDLGKLTAILNPAIDRYQAKSNEDKDVFSGTLARFIRIYAFITQVCRMFDRDIHKFSVYAKFLLKFLPTKDIERIKIDDKILLEYYHLEKDFEGAINLAETASGFSPITGEAGAKERKKDSLSQIIAKINEKFGTKFTEMDKVILQMENDMMTNEKWQDYARNNDKDTFGILFEKDFNNIVTSRYEQNDAFFVKMLEDQSFMNYVRDLMKEDMYKKLKGKGV
jgi:type I restriction enzyme R subunit